MTNDLRSWLLHKVCLLTMTSWLNRSQILLYLCINQSVSHCTFSCEKSTTSLVQHLVIYAYTRINRYARGVCRIFHGGGWVDDVGPIAGYSPLYTDREGLESRSLHLIKNGENPLDPRLYACMQLP